MVLWCVWGALTVQGQEQEEEQEGGVTAAEVDLLRQELAGALAENQRLAQELEGAEERARRRFQKEVVRQKVAGLEAQLLEQEEKVQAAEFRVTQLLEEQGSEPSESPAHPTQDLAGALAEARTLADEARAAEASLKLELEECRSALTRPKESMTLEMPPTWSEPQESPRREPSPGDEEAVQAVLDWAKAWSAQDVEAYLGSYSRLFAPENGATRPVWQAQRERRLRGPEFIEVALSELELRVDPSNQAILRFRQNYRSNTFRDEVQKVLVLVVEDGAWKIVRERSGLIEP